ncbi:MAG: indolepyruvate oxidoreductase subunit beta [Candidatus Bathyarchaeia archaeon]|nr:indolepyruvate oxidoreductase subunit beta [Candidatus Bathyarchaeota archaeon]
MNILLSGVGGQGILTLAELLGDAAILDGYEVRVSEVHGMAQRGGQVVCHVRFGKNVYSPLIIEGASDMLISLEVLESLRAARYLKHEGVVIINSLELPPPLAIIKGIKYPSINDAIKEFMKITKKIYVINSMEIIKRNRLPAATINTIILGSAWATGELGLSRDSLIKAMIRRFGEKWKDINIKAFEEGAKYLSETGVAKV